MHGPWGELHFLLLEHMFGVSWLEEKDSIDARSGVAPVWRTNGSPVG